MAVGARSVVGRAVVGERLPRVLVVVALVLATAGAAIAAYLVFENLQGEAGVCTIAHGCETVQKSRYGKMFGVPVSVPGFGLYLGLVGLGLAWQFDLRSSRRMVTLLAFAAALFGVVFSGYLTYLEAFVIDAWCIYCLSSAALMMALFALWATVAVTYER